MRSVLHQRIPRTVSFTEYVQQNTFGIQAQRSAIDAGQNSTIRYMIIQYGARCTQLQHSI